MNTQSPIIDYGTASEPEPIVEPSTASPEREQHEEDPFPLECLPEPFRDMARAVCDTVNVPPSLAGPAVLGAMSMSLGAGIQVRSRVDRLTRANLYVLIGAPSGKGKSEVFRHVCKPFQTFAKEKRDFWKENTLPGILGRQDAIQLRKDGIRQQLKSGKVKDGELEAKLQDLHAETLEVEDELGRCPRLFTQDATSQALPVLMAKQPLETLTSLSADAREVCDIIRGKYNKGGGADDSFYVQAWTGDWYEGDRIGRESLNLVTPCLSGLWAVQPGKMDEMFTNSSLLDSGFLCRILSCQSDAEPQEIERNPKGIPDPILSTYEGIHTELLEAFRTAQEPVLFDPTQEAQDAMLDHFNANVKKVKGELRDVESFVCRWTEQAWKIAVILHAGGHGRRAGGFPLSVETARDAIKIADWFSSQQLAVLSAGRYEKKREKWEAVLLLFADMKTDGILPRDVQRVGIERTAVRARRLLEDMAKAGKLKTEARESADTGRKPKDPYYLKP